MTTGRYQRQERLAEWGERAQARLAGSHVLIVGCGALGSHAAELLARAGVGRLTIVDRDLVDETNLHRQLLFDERDAADGTPKAWAAAKRLGAINSGVSVEAVVADFTHRNAERIVERCGGVGAIVDATDNFVTRYLVNDLAVKRGVPVAYAGVLATHAMSFTVLPGVTACMRCVFPDPPEPGAVGTCETEGVLGPVATIAAACQVIDVLKILTGNERRLSGTMLRFDAWSNERQRLGMDGAKRADCVCCGKRVFEFLDGRGAQDAVRLCGGGGGETGSDAGSRSAVQLSPREHPTEPLDLKVLGLRMFGTRPHEVTAFMVRGTIANPQRPGEACDITVFADGRAIIRGTDDVGTARSLYAALVGV